MTTAAKRLRLASQAAAAHRVWQSLDLEEAACAGGEPNLIEDAVIIGIRLRRFAEDTGRLAADLDDDPDEADLDDNLELAANG